MRQVFELHADGRDGRVFGSRVAGASGCEGLGPILDPLRTGEARLPARG
ncbi:MAG TPA: hypothetical protein RMH99_25320 [Sandaracinaceae bacterium LLY-WYZ-13_1]|nr:hypothetical protein [Sandaracinaceae bacterium LLY-WYZ-13_1]